jgi:cell division septal protein FtsQ
MAKKGGASRRRFPVLPTVLLTAAILGLPTIVYAWGRSSESFTIERLRVSGTELVPRRTVVRLLRADYLGENLFTVTTGDVRATLRPLAYVEDVRVDRDFPHTLRVAVIEHEPALYVLGANGWFVVADDGFVIRSAAGDAEDGASDAGGDPPRSSATATEPAASASPAAGGAAAGGAETEGPAAQGAAAQGAADDAATAADLTGTEPPGAALKKGPPDAALRLPVLALDERLTAGTTLTRPALGAALHVVHALPAPRRRDVRIVQVTPRGDVTLRLDGGLVVRWGDRRRSLAKTLAVKAVLAAYRRAGKQAMFLDVSVPDRVLARPILK